MSKIEKNKVKVLSIMTATAVSLCAAQYAPNAAYGQPSGIIDESVNTGEDGAVQDTNDPGGAGQEVEAGDFGSDSFISTQDGQAGSDDATEGNGSNGGDASSQPASGSSNTDSTEAVDGADLTDPADEGTASEEISVDLSSLTSSNDQGKQGSGSSSYDINDTLPEDIIDRAADKMNESLSNFQSDVTFVFPQNVLNGVILTDTEKEEYSAYTDATADEDSLKVIKLSIQILRKAAEHTGDPMEGDMLFVNFHSAAARYYEDNGSYALGLSGIRYLMLENDIDSLEDISSDCFSGLGSSASDYEKVKTAYDYLYGNVSYSVNGTASAAGAKDGRLSSQGYASLLYYLLNDVGVDARIITGEGKAWVIAKVNGAYYNLDPASDAGARNEESYACFLKGSRAFSSSHKPDAIYTTDIFQAGYPVSETDYVLSSVSLDMSSCRLAVGQTISLEATSSSGGEVRFSSSDTEVATVSQSGTVTAVKSGQAVITATDGEGAASCTVYVTEEYTLTVEAEDGITEYVSGAGDYLEGEIVTITAIPQTKDGYRFVSWNLPSGIQILDGGTVNDARLSFYMPDNDVSATAVYEKIGAEKIVLDQASLEMKRGEKQQLSWSVEPSDAYLEDVTFTSSDRTVATVDRDGVITAVSRGTATITVKCGNLTADCDVTVIGEEYEIRVVGRNSSGVLTTQKKTVTAGESITISVPDVEKYGYRFTGWDPSVTVTFDSGYRADDIKVSFTMPDSNLTMTAQYEEIKVESVSLNTKSVTLAAGKEYKLSSHVKISPSNALDDEITYKSSDETVAKVSESGTITAVSAGTATITVTCGGKSAEFKVTVTGKGTTASGTELLNITVSKLRMYEGRTYNLSVNKRNVGTVTFSSSNTSIATVDSSGKVTGVSAGTCTITAVSESGKTSDTVEVTVVARATSSSSTTGSVNGLTEEQADVFKANAAKHKANADKIRADAIRAGYVADGSGNTTKSTSSASGDTSSGSSAVTSDEGVSSEGGGVETSGTRPENSQPTGDGSHLPFWTLVSGSLAAAVFALYRSLRRDKSLAGIEGCGEDSHTRENN